MNDISRRLGVAVLLVAAVVTLEACGGSTATPALTAAGAISPAAPAPAATGTGAPVEAGATGVAVGPGGDLCNLLGPGDFAAVGVDGAHAPSENPDGTGGNYCVYAGLSGATGGVEFDAFLGDAAATYRTISEETGMLTDLAAADLPGADQAAVLLAGQWNAIVVRKGQLAFAISLPANDNARTQLISLSTLVMQRAGALV